MEIAKIIGKNIEAVIKQNAMTIEECAKLIGVTRQTISKYISGESVIDSGKLFTLARYFNKSIQYFMSVNEDTMSFMFRAEDPKNNFSPKDRDFINDKFNKIFNVLSITNLNKVIFIPESYKINVGKKLSLEDKMIIKEIAEKERRSFEISSLSIGEIYSALEKKNINIIALEYDNLDLDAISAYSNDKGAFIFINDSKDIPEERKLFSLMHEYAHLIFHRDMYLSSEGDLAYSTSRNDINEKIANLFASYFLIPRDTLKKESKKYSKFIDLKAVCNLKKKYGVSAEALLYALKDEEIINNGIYGHLRKKLNELGFATKEPQPLPYEDKNEKLHYILKELYINDKITSNMISDLLGTNIIETRKLLKEWNMDGYE